MMIFRFLAGLLFVTTTAIAQVPGEVVFGRASFYHRKFEGRRTSSGEQYHSLVFSAAHNTFPFGTLLEVTNLANNRSCTVRVNDRGPFAHDRILDVSQAAADSLGMRASGIADIRFRVLTVPQPDGTVWRETLGEAPKVEFKEYPVLKVDFSQKKLKLDTLRRQ
jgi:rare lipoprotein A